MIDLEYEAWKGNIGPGAALRESIQRDNEERMAKKAAAAPQGIKIDADVIELLKTGTWLQTADGDSAITVPMTNDRKLYERMAKLLTVLGGKWNRKEKATVFADDPDAEAAVREALENGTYVDSKQLYQFFETQRETADAMVAELELLPGPGDTVYTVLEPNAGHGALINAVAAACVHGVDVELTAIEIDPAKEARLREFVGGTGQITKRVLIADFLHYRPDLLKQYDRIIMNPPFARQQDIDHVRHAYQFLAPGGVMVAIMSPSHTFRTNKKTVDFLEWLGECTKRGSVTQRGLPAGAFKASGTNIRTVMVTIKKKK